MELPDQTRHSPERLYEDLLWRLHGLDRAGKLDSAEADELREQMDAPWAALGELEQHRLAGLSEDLYSLSEQELEREPSADAQATLRDELKGAMDRQDWEGLLELLRRSKPPIPAAVAAYVRGRCWRSLGRPEVATWFFREAHDREPSNAHYCVLFLDSLFKAGRWQEAIALADRLLSDPGSPPAVVFGAAKSLFDSTRGLPQADARPILERVVAALRTTPGSERVTAVVPSLLLAARITLAISLERLDRNEDAQRVHDEAVAQWPESGEARMARALFLLRVRPADAKAELDELVARGTTLAYPYAFLGHEALQRGDWERCITLCDEGIRRPAPLVLLAGMLEWIAIAQYNLGAPADVVRATFDAALLLDPLNDRIRSNREELEREVDTRPRSNRWFRIDATMAFDAARDELLTRFQLAA